MAALFAETPGRASRNTLAIAERCNLKLNFGRLNFPAARPCHPGRRDADDYLARICRERLPQRYPNAPDVRRAAPASTSWTSSRRPASPPTSCWSGTSSPGRASSEIPCGPRGSAAGSIILYLLGIADVDPDRVRADVRAVPEPRARPDARYRHGLRRRAPRRGHPVRASSATARDHVAQIVTFGRLLARAAIRDVGRALGYPLNEVERVAKLIPHDPGRHDDRQVARAESTS